MRRQSNKWAWLLAALATLAPGVAWGQEAQPSEADATGYGQPDPNLWMPLGNTHPGLGGFYLNGGYAMYRQTNPLNHQTLAVTGFTDVNGFITGVPGTFVGSHLPVLDAYQVSGPQSYQPGFTMAAGWKFRNGSVLTLDFLYISEAKFTADATLARQGLQEGFGLRDSFLSSPVFNYPSDFAGPPLKTIIGGAEDLFGIWNGASAMTLMFLQRAQQWQLTYREPVYQTATYRLSGLVGPRFFWLWEDFRWLTTDLDFLGQSNASWQAQYDNVISNRMYGGFVGCSNEWYLGCGFACQLDLSVATFIDSVKKEAMYSLVQRGGPESKRSRTDYVFVPEISGMFGIQWYPTEGIQLMLGYNAMLFFNTVTSFKPVSFDYSALTPTYNRTMRLFDGLTANVTFIF